MSYIVKDKFILLKDIPNYINLEKSTVDKQAVSNDVTNLTRTIKMMENRINHFTKKHVLKLISSDAINNKISVVNMKNYPLRSTCNKKTKRMIINLAPFNVDEISRLDFKDVYALVVYGITFSTLVQRKTSVKESYATPIINFLSTVFVRIFGKEYGLMGPYSRNIPFMKFLIGSYVYISFFGLSKDNAFAKSSKISGVNYKQSDVKSLLDKIDFTRIDELIDSLNTFKIMPGITKYSFTAKILRFLGVGFIPALEDLSRFLAYITTSNISGNSITKTFIYSYNVNEFRKILKISENIFK